MSPVDETLEVVAKPKRASRQRVAAVVKANAEETSAPRLRVTKKRTSKVTEDVQQNIGAKKLTRSSSSHEPKTDKTTVAKKEQKPADKVETKTNKTIAVERKAPTPLADKKTAIKTLRRQIVVIALLLCIGIGASAAIGRTDQGQIDVSKVITERNDRISRGEEQGEIVSAQPNSTLPDGGLIGLGVNGPIDGSGQAPVATSTDTSSTTASSTATGNIPLTTAEAEAEKAKQATSTP
jgi:hypothetical protein